MMKALVVGGTGLTGSALLQLLSESKKYDQVYSLVRKKNQHALPGIVEVLTDFSSEKLFSNWDNIHDVYCCLGTTIKQAGSQEAFRFVDYTLPVKLAEEAKKHNARHLLIISALGANKGSSIFYNRVKGEMEEALKSKGFQQLSILQPSLLMGHRKEKRSGEKIAQWIMPLLSPLLLGSLKKYRGIEAVTVARAMMRLADRKETGCTTYDSAQLTVIGKA